MLIIWIFKKLGKIISFTEFWGSQIFIQRIYQNLLLFNIHFYYVIINYDNRIWIYFLITRQISKKFLTDNIPLLAGEGYRVRFFRNTYFFIFISGLKQVILTLNSISKSQNFIHNLLTYQHSSLFSPSIIPTAHRLFQVHFE